MPSSAVGGGDTTINRTGKIPAIKAYSPKDEHIVKYISSMSDNNKCYGEKYSNKRNRNARHGSEFGISYR